MTTIKFKCKLYSDFLEKYFSKLADQRQDEITLMGTALTELTKILVLHNTCNTNLKHWLDETVGFFMTSISKGFSPTMLFLPLSGPKDVFPAGFDKDSIFKRYRGKESGTNEDLVKNFIKIINTVKESGSYKYKTAISQEKANGTFLSEEDYFYQFRYIALCMSGQLDPEDLESSHDSMIYDGTKISFEKFFNPITSVTKIMIRKRLIKCLENIFGESKELK